jgi:dTDP-L-rhamnose 4-epimerase
MQNHKILITGGAGFIGKHLATRLLEEGNEVRILDSFNSQIHECEDLPKFLQNNIDLVKGDIRNRDLLRKALKNINKVVHYAAETGTGQSMYDIEKYFDVNVQGTATLIDLMQNDQSGKDIDSVVVASSRSIYGEGLYRCKEHGDFYPLGRKDQDILEGQFDLICPECKKEMASYPTPESGKPNPLSFYAITKLTQEQAILLFAKNKGINGFALRYQNVYGPGQSLKNPYTGILAVFSSLARQNLPLNIFEDGMESRDFVYIDDVVEVTSRALNYKDRYVGSLNVGSGEAESVLSLAEKIKSFYRSNSPIKITGEYRKGDIRHNRADIEKLFNVLKFKPEISLKYGIDLFLRWANNEPIHQISYEKSIQELKDSQMLIKANS